MDASASVESGLGTSGCATCNEATSDLAHQPSRGRARARSSPQRSWFPAAEAVVTTQHYTLCCALAGALFAIVLFAITGAVWYAKQYL